MTVAVDELRDGERERLRELEDRIERGLLSAIQTGRDLAEIRDRRLYRERGQTFEAYVEERFGIERRHAYRLIAAAGVAAELSPTGHIPTSERVARELGPLRDEPDMMREAWGAAVEQHGPKPTAAQVREIVRPEDPGDDIRFGRIENAADSLRTLPAIIHWPTQPGDVAAMDEAFAFLSSWLPPARAAWREHKAKIRAADKASRANLKAVA